MLDRNSIQKQIVGWSAKGVFLAVIMLLIVMMYNGARLSGVTETTRINLAIGPLRLVEIAKIKSNDGFIASVSYQTGVAYYFATSLVLGALLGYLSSRNDSRE
jgi:hypothetical protein